MNPSSSLPNRPPFIRSGLFFAVLAINSVTVSPPLLAQFKFREPPNRQTPGAIANPTALDLWEAFRANRAVGAFSLEGLLTYRPARAPSVTFRLELKASWYPQTELTRLRLHDPLGAAVDTALFRSPQGLFRERKDDSGDAVFTAVGTDELDTPLLGNLPLSLNDVLLPFANWLDPQYQGPDRFLGRPAHVFIVTNPQPDAREAFARVTIDEDFAALLRVDFLDGSRNLVRRIRVSGFQRFGQEWMMSEVIWENRQTRDSVRLQVEQFQRNQIPLQSPVFAPDGSGPEDGS